LIFGTRRRILADTVQRPGFFGIPAFWSEVMKREFKASVSREGDWFVAQCLEVDVASQGPTEEQALANLEEALALHFEPPRAGL
jgi:hypothetical protein